MNQFVPGITEIQGRQCLIVADAISHALPTEEVVLLDQVGDFNIFCLAEELAKKKAKYENLPIYGYWQTLYRSGHWQPSSGIIAYQHGSGGQYVSVDIDEKNAVTGEVVNGVAIATAGEICDQQTIQWIDLSLTALNLPKNPAMTLTEQLARQGKYRKTLLIASIAIISTLVAGVILGGWIADRETRINKAEFSALNQKIATARVVIEDLSQTRLVAHPNQTAILNLLESLSWVTGLEIPISAVDKIKLSIPYQSYSDLIAVLKHYDVPFEDQWLADGKVVVSLQ